MSIFHSRSPPFVPPPDDLTVSQFVLGDPSLHHTKPVRPKNMPCLVSEDTGKAVYASEILERSAALARSIKGKWNINPGDIVSVYSPNNIDTPVLFWAIHKLGATIAAHSSALTPEELVYQLKIVEPVLLVTHPANLATALSAFETLNYSHDRMFLFDGTGPQHATITSINGLIAAQDKYPPHVEHKLKPGEAKTAVAFLCYSSGTTGNPKAIRISHYNIMSNIVQGATHIRQNDESVPEDMRRFRAGDVAAGALPLYHMYGINQLFYTIYLGMTVVLSQGFNFEKYLQSIERFRVTHLYLVPPIVVLLCKHPLTKKFNLSNVRYCMVAAAPLSVELQQAFLRLIPGVMLGQGYGLTECTAGVTTFPLDCKVAILGGAGRLIPGTSAKVVKADGSLAGVGERGEIWVKGPQVTLGYHRNDEATRETFIDGWVRTGDEVVFNEDGEMFVTDRIKELIKVKGLQVAPSELEGRLLDHPDVADAAVIAVPHDFSGEAPRAYIVLKPDVAAALARNGALVPQTKEKLYKHVASVAAKYKWLDGGIEFIDAIPKSPTGKILRRILKERSKAAVPEVVKSRL